MADLMASSASMEQCTVDIELVRLIAYRRLVWLYMVMVIHTLDGRQAELLGNLSVLDLAGIIEAHAADKLGQVAARGDGRAAAKSLELDLGDLLCLRVDSDLQLHDIATSRSANEAGADVSIALVHGADISWPRIVIQHLLVVGSLGLDGCDGGELSSSEGWSDEGGSDSLP